MKVDVIALKPTYYPNGGHKDVGAKFAVDDDDTLASYEKAGLLMRSAPVAVDEQTGDSAPAVDVASGTLEQVQALWDVDTSPKEYLEQYPEGPLADLALRILELSAESEISIGE